MCQVQNGQVFKIAEQQTMELHSNGSTLVIAYQELANPGILDKPRYFYSKRFSKLRIKFDFGLKRDGKV